MKIYVAASWMRRDEARKIAERVRAAGHVIVARWLFAAGASGEYVHSDMAMAAYSLADLADVRAADAVVCLNGDPPGLRSRGGKYGEQGAALILGKRVLRLGPPEGIHDWNPAVEACGSVEELLAALGQEPAVRR